MDEASVDDWFAAYLTDFVALGRGEAKVPRLLSVSSETRLLSDTCALHRGRFIRRRTHGTEITSFTAHYLIAALPARMRITSLAIHATA